MSAIIREEFKTNILQNFINSLGSNSLYLGIGRSHPWDLIGNMDTTVPVPTNTIKTANEDWEDLLALKRITQSDVSAGMFREDWVANTTYDIYRHDWDGSRTATYDGPNKDTAPTKPTSLSEVKCFVVTSTFNIYACIKKPSDTAKSLYSPDTGVAVGTSTGVVKTADGYYWKFLAVTSTADMLKFNTKYYHPIKTLTVAPGTGDPYLNQWNSQVDSATHKGGIYTINVITSGTGYNSGAAGSRIVTDAESDAYLRVLGNGVGLEYTVEYGSGGSIESIEITNPGSGYTFATIQALNGTGASFDVIFTPMRGFGADPVQDVAARFLISNTVITGSENNDFIITNDYRKIILISNPTDYGSSTIATRSTANACWTLMISPGLGINEFPLDGVITGSASGAKGRVVEYDSTTGALKVIRTENENTGQVGGNNSFTITDTITAASPGTGSEAVLSIIPPEIQPYSGQVIYSEYRAPISRSELQTDNFKVIVKF